ncbi:MAG: lipoyl(octanoyl) transferase LipB [Planctomycetota bacterium]
MAPAFALEARDLGSLPYQNAYEIQCRTRDEVLAWREAGDSHPSGVLLLVEHDPPVITVSKRAGASDHLVATPAMLEATGVVVEQTDRGGDITYHGPGQLVVYPIVDLNRLNLNLHSYMRFLEAVIIETCSSFGIQAHRDHCATGVWVGGNPDEAGCETPASGGAKIAAIGVRVRKWVTMHGLALNVTTNLDHFNLIVPCGLVGRQVTSMQEQLGDTCPTMQQVKDEIVRLFNIHALAQLRKVEARG